MDTTTRKATCSDCKHEARERQLRACVHETSRGWIVATWSERHAQYQADRYVRATSGDAHTAVADAARALDAPSSEYWSRCTHGRGNGA